MLSVYLGDGPHTVRGLATALKISKPAVSRALDRLGELGYVRRQRDDMDVNCGDVLDGVPLAEVSRRIFDAVLRHASGEKVRSECLGYGRDEFVPWQVGAVM